MKQLPKEIQSIMQEIRFVTEGGSCFECCDYEGMVTQLGEVLQKYLPQEQEAKPQIARTSSDIERIMLEIDEAKEQIKRYLKTKTQ